MARCVSLEPIDVRLPTSRPMPGVSTEMLPASIRDHRFPDGPVWSES
jgi:hypothetical protein